MSDGHKKLDVTERLNTQIMTALCEVEAGGDTGLMAGELKQPMAGVLNTLGWVRKDEIRGVYFLTPEGKSEADRWRHQVGQGALLTKSDPVSALIQSAARELGIG
jgi:hypothetical protein